MLYFKSLRESEKVLLALGQPVRLKIMELLYQNEMMSISELAKNIGVTNGAISTHVAVLEEADLVRVKETLAKHGTTKLVTARHDRLSIDLEEEFISNPFYQDSIKIGHYTKYDVSGKCGIATNKKMIGAANDKRTFSYAERFNAGIIWLEQGYVEYSLPNHLRPGRHINRLQISLEMSSFNDDIVNNLSDVEFYINDKKIGDFTCKGEEGGRKGYLTDVWWPDSLNQFGELVTIDITPEGTFVRDEEKISDFSIDDININYESQINFRIDIPKDAPNKGGLVLYGEKFGDYPQDIKIKVYY